MVKYRSGTLSRQLTGELSRQCQQSVVSQHSQPQSAQRGQLGLHQSDETVGWQHVCAQIVLILILISCADWFSRLRLCIFLDFHCYHINLEKPASTKKISFMSSQVYMIGGCVTGLT